MMDEHTNLLAKEKSPYLLQHAHNPVNWHPWGQAAFDEARAKDKPVFLSIGYSSCHWCHVMEEESFENPEIARLLNEAFVCIKVDREERPDIDGVYMEVCRMMTGGGGWPLTILMTPDKSPFFAGTYLPPESRWGRPGLKELALRVGEMWRSDREKLLETGEKVKEALISSAPAGGDSVPGEKLLSEAFEAYSRSFDARWGGFGGKPKFPAPQNLMFLMRYRGKASGVSALKMVEKTLDAMRSGGIYDQIGYGFHRYSVDEKWLVPHFEKMLYDQALISMACLEAYQATGFKKYSRTAAEVFGYVLERMRSRKGGFYTSEDADSEGGEGSFYLWTEDEVERGAGKEYADLAVTAFGLSPQGNFIDARRPMEGKDNVLSFQFTEAELADRFGLTPAELGKRIETIRKRLLAVRNGRPRPPLDDKILASWNGLMTAALARGGRVLEDDTLTKAAEEASNFVFSKMYADGRLYHRYRDGDAAVSGNLDDYAFLLWGEIELYETTFHTVHLERALKIAGTLDKHFRDEENGAFFFTSDDAEKVLVRRSTIEGGAVPSGNGIAAWSLIRLSRLTGDTGLEESGLGVLKAFAPLVSRAPHLFPGYLIGLDYAIGPSREVVITGRPGGADTLALFGELRRRFLPRTVLLFRPDGKEGKELDRLAPFSKEMESSGGKAEAFVCVKRACMNPVDKPSRLAKLLETRAKNG